VPLFNTLQCIFLHINGICNYRFYFHIFFCFLVQAYQFTYKLSEYSSFKVNTEILCSFLSLSPTRNILSSLHLVHSVQFFLNWRNLRSEAVFDSAILIMCPVQWNLDLSTPQRSFSRICRVPSLVRNKVPYK
jgi:hypothetical protein